MQTCRGNDAKFQPQYSVSNLRDSTVYSMPLENGGSIDVRFRLVNRPEAELSPPQSYRDIKVEFLLELRDPDGQVLAATPMDKEDVVTLQKLLTSSVEHSTVRRFQWFVEVLSETQETPQPVTVSHNGRRS